MRSGLYCRLRQISYTADPIAVAPGQVTGLVADTAAETSVPLSWAQPSGTTPMTYRVEYKRAADSVWTLDVTQASTTRTVTGLQAGTAYQFRVRAENAAGAGPYSTSVNAETASTLVAPGAPLNLRTLGGGSSSQINLAWDRGTGGAPDQYEVWHRAGSVGSFTQRGTTANTNFLFSINTSVTEHYVYVVARNSAGSAQSATMQVTVA